MKFMKRVFTVVFALLYMSMYCIVPAYAIQFDSVEASFDIVGVADWLVKAGTWGRNWVFSNFNDDYCNQSSETNGRHKFIEQHTQVDGETGNYYICEYCGKSAGEVLNEAESEYVATLPATGVNSDGGLIWTPALNDIESITFYVSYQPVNTGYDTNFSVTGDFNYTCNLYNDTKVWVTNNDGILNVKSSGNRVSVSCKSILLNLPVMGKYTVLNSIIFDGINSYNFNDSHVKASWVSNSSLNCLTLNKQFPVNDYLFKYKYGVTNGIFYLPQFLIKPDVSYDVSSTNTSDTYNIGTRASSITGNYGIVNSGSGTVEKIDSQTIVNETNNTYYSPATGQPETFNDWSYDYSDRSYTLTLESGDTTTVTYGDEYVTIQEGDTVTNIYYITETSSGGNGGGEDTPSTPTHRHSYTSEVTTEPTCTRSGVRTYTCDGCGNTYTENIPATGHAWEVVNQQFAQYGSSDGVLMQAGFIVYECSVCGQQIRMDDESLPPGVIGQDLELQEVSNQALSLIPQLKPMYEGYLGLLQDTFPYLPNEIMQLMLYGVSAAVLIGIWKAIRG